MKKTQSKVIKIHPADTVLVALSDLKQSDEIIFQDKKYILTEAIPAKHKFFTQDMNFGDEIKMYGVTVGKISIPFVKVGQRMTVDNTKHAAEPYAYRNINYQWKSPDVSKFATKTFNGYHRKDGRVGTANYWLFIPTVFCENRNLDVIKEALHNTLGYAVTDKYKRYTEQLLNSFEKNGTFTLSDLSTPDLSNNKRVFKNIDGIKFLNHAGGCGGTRQDSATLSKLLVAYADHPNVAGITLLSLGCQHLQVSDFLRDLKERNSSFDKPVIIFEQQQTKSEEALIKEAILKTFEQLIIANKIERKPAPLSNLCIGVKCGGSDGFSGISANPAVGYTSDLLVALGGKIIDRKSTRLNSSHSDRSRMPSSA